MGDKEELGVLEPLLGLRRGICDLKSAKIDIVRAQVKKKFMKKSR